MKKLFQATIFLLFSIAAYGNTATGYEISIKISDLRDSSVYIAYHLGDKQYIKDTLTLDGNGYALYKGTEELPQGIYMIVLPGRSYFEFLASSDQVFSVECLYKDWFNTLAFTGSDENSAFLEYQKHWVSLQQRAASLNRRIQANSQNSDSLRIIRTQQIAHETGMKSYLRGVVNDNEGNLLALLVKTLLPVEIPIFTIPVGSHNPDSIRSLKSYIYNKDHFFDNIDLTDERIIRTPVLQAKLNTFFTNVVIQLPDSVNREIDILLSKCSSNYKVYQYVAVYLFNHYRESEIMGHDAIIVKLADDIYLSGKADWVSADFISDLRKQVELMRPNLIGNKAPDLVMNTFNGVYVSLNDLKKDFTILYFWEPDCSHCQVATPILKDYYEKVRGKGIEVFAVCTQSDKPAWEKYIAEHQLSWINGWDPERISHFDALYNIQSTPVVYILDRDKTIIAKKLAVEDIEPFIENYRKFYYKED